MSLASALTAKLIWSGLGLKDGGLQLPKDWKSTMSRRKALLIGIEKYRFLRHLKGCANDVAGLAEILQRPGYQFEVEILTEAQAKRSSIRQSINSTLSDAEFSIIYFAGHGLRTKTATYLATADHEPGDEGIDLSYLSQAIKGLVGQNQSVLLILDCCHSGGADLGEAENSARAMESGDIPAFLGSGIVLMAACGSLEKAKEVVINGTTHGAFTYSLLQALMGKAANAQHIVTVSRVYEYVSEELEKQGQQRPKLTGDQNGRMILATGIEGTGGTKHEPQGITHAVVLQAKQLMDDYFTDIPKLTREQYLSEGHREASQRLAPIVEWFSRRLKESPALRSDTDFDRALSNMYQQFQTLSSVVPGMILEKGRIIGSYVGSGTFGTVWRVDDKSKNGLTCFKGYHATDLRNEDKAARFERGFKAMSQLAHPNIVKVHEMSRVPLGFFMDFIDGPNFRSYNPATSLDFPQIVELLLFVAETLRHAHGRKVLHRDVKPENILLSFSESGRVSAHLTDFDLSWFSTATKLTKLAGDGFGSHFYAAPEQMNSPTSHAAHRETVDVYSFGQVIYFSVCGRDPGMFDMPGNRKGIMEALSRLPVSEKVTRSMVQLYEGCTTLEASSRIGDFGTICTRLSTILADARSVAEEVSSNEFFSELRYLMAGLAETGSVPKASLHSISFRSPSGRTEISVRVKREAEKLLAIEATFYANQIVVEGLNAVDSRAKVNSRMDSALQPFVSVHQTRRTPGKSGAFESHLNFEAIPKTISGITKAREILMAAVDSIERT